MIDEIRFKIIHSCNEVLMHDGAGIKDKRFFNDVLRLVYDDIDFRHKVKNLECLIKQQQEEIEQMKKQLAEKEGE